MDHVREQSGRIREVTDRWKLTIMYIAVCVTLSAIIDVISIVRG